MFYSTSKNKNFKDNTKAVMLQILIQHQLWSHKIKFSKLYFDMILTCTIKKIVYISSKVAQNVLLKS